MTWHWYISRPDELLLDLDSRSALKAFALRLRYVIRGRFLPVREVWLFRSASGGDHYHVFIQLAKPLMGTQRAIWQLYLASDQKRELYNLMRIEHGLIDAILLIAREEYPIPDRLPDYTCNCPEKHRKAIVYHRCPVIKQLHGAQAGKSYFPSITRGPSSRWHISLPLGERISPSYFLGGKLHRSKR